MDEVPNSIREQLVTLITGMLPLHQWTHLACQVVFVVNGVHSSVRLPMIFPTAAFKAPFGTMRPRQKVCVGILVYFIYILHPKYTMSMAIVSYQLCVVGNQKECEEPVRLGQPLESL